MTEIQHVTGTAFIVAEYRAQENAEQNPLYRDPIVPLFLSERTRQAANRVAADFPPGGKGVKLRTRCVRRTGPQSPTIREQLTPIHYSEG
jgi:O-methyltransferase involved in polyketide biosynthesis